MTIDARQQEKPQNRVAESPSAPEGATRSCSDKAVTRKLVPRDECPKKARRARQRRRVRRRTLIQCRARKSPTKPLEVPVANATAERVSTHPQGADAPQVSICSRRSRGICSTLVRFPGPDGIVTAALTPTPRPGLLDLLGNRATSDSSRTPLGKTPTTRPPPKCRGDLTSDAPRGIIAAHAIVARGPRPLRLLSEHASVILAARRCRSAASLHRLAFQRGASGGLPLG